MSIKTGQTTGIVPIGSSDTTLSDSPTGQSQEFYAPKIHNTGSSPISVELFISSGTTGLSGERVYFDAIDAGETVLIPPMLVGSGKNLIGKADITGATFIGIFTLRTGTDV